ncbi:zinc-binding dehydrogenase [Plantactinospora siamensis]|uniref:Zinc-binding dehydrogenase n=1 Tax=Plantactinospora siamensis TaxID=555372 RepID=A0ABV6P7P4_9ACTN
MAQPDHGRRDRKDLRVRVERVPFDRIADAHRRIEAGATTGKLVLDLRTT